MEKCKKLIHVYAIYKWHISNTLVVINKMSIKLAPFTTKEERYLWDDMQRDLHRHSSYYVRKQYYPFKLDVWETMRKSIEDDYRSKILELQKEIKVSELQEKKEMEKKREEEETLKAANALLSLSKTKNTKSAATASVRHLRRSTRIANKNH